MTNHSKNPRNNTGHNETGMPTDKTRQNKTTTTEWPPESPKTQTVQAKVRQPKLYISLQTEQKLNRKNTEDHQG